MKISVSSHSTFYYKEKQFTKFSELIELVTSKKNYSCGVFTDGHRNLKNFEKAYTIGLDIDNGENETQMSLVEATELFKDHKHIIMTSKSHGIEKHGKVADRFRVLLFLETPITDQKNFYATWQSLKDKYDAIDGQCKDPSRFWYPSKEVVSKNENGSLIKTVKYVEPEKKEVKEVATKGKLARHTLDFITFGAPDGLWNGALSKAAIDIREQGYDKEETIALLSKPTGYLDESDLRVVDSVYNKELRYEARDDGSCFNLQTIDEIYESKEVVEWFMDRMLMKGGFSIIGGDPKAGKSTIIRQLCKHVINGEDFFGRSTQKANVLYLALEEFVPLIKEQFAQVGIKKGDPLLIHAGGFKNFEKRYENLEKVVLEHKLDFVVVDTMALFCNIGDLNDYNSVNKELVKLREIARRTGAHVMVIHHINKGYMGKAGSLLGSQAIKGAFDTIIKLTKRGRERSITTEGRGLVNYWDHPLEFDWDTQSYTLGEKRDDDDY